MFSPDISAPLIKLESVGLRRQDKIILQNIDWAIYPGQQWAIVGPNGGGKTMLMQLVTGRLPCSAGRVVYADANLPGQIAQVSFEQHQQWIAREQEQAVFRQFSKSGDEGTTLGQFLVVGSPTNEGDTGLNKLLQLMDLDHLVGSALLALSNGEMRKALIARALRRQPRLLILDEPFDGLDARSRPRLAEIVDHLMSAGTQILLVTHRSEELTAGITHLLGLKAGRIAFCSDKKAVMESDLIPRLYAETQSGTHSASPGRPAPLSVAGQNEPGRQPTVVMKDVTIKYGEKLVLDGFSWTANRDENWAIVGPNGAGKTTLLRLISADHVQAYANEIYLFGRRRGSGESIWEIKHRIGVLSPEFQIGYREEMLANQVVLSGLFDSIGLYRQASHDQQRQAQDWINLLGVADLAQRDFNRLSYGQKRMVLLVRALVKSPEMLLLDEPCQGLDRENCQRLVGMVNQVHRQTGTQIFYITHRQDELPACITHLLEFERSAGEQEHHYTARTGPLRKASG